MYGVTKLHLYQITYYEKEVFEIQQKFDLMLRREREKHIDAVEDFDIDPFKLPLVREDNPQLDENLHLLPEQDLSDRLCMMREAEVCQYFGALTDKELDIMYEDDIFSLEKRLQTVRYSQERDGIEMIDDIEIAEGR
ncbi:meiotic recombination protein rec8-like protein [Lasius niger]|uniref:Meiotic recombination protein rec8-like protein n=1 Tax=Lasius niger TaxID=67767 RepID=A0A0J7JYT8_LASNI|nr:meiotic recombination protein rec8-like protein [Lasius niger]